MRQFLRVIRCGRWYKHPEIGWLGKDELQSDALCDIQTKENKLSVYMISSEDDKLRVIVALAANRDNPSNLDYAVFDESRFDSLDITVKQTEGYTPDAMANTLHYEIVDLTVKRLAMLAEVISTGQHDRILEREIKMLLHDAANEGRIDEKLLKPNILKCLQRDT